MTDLVTTQRDLESVQLMVEAMSWIRHYEHQTHSTATTEKLLIKLCLWRQHYENGDYLIVPSPRNPHGTIYLVKPNHEATGVYVDEYERNYDHEFVYRHSTESICRTEDGDAQP